MNQDLIDKLKQNFKGEISIDPGTLEHFSRDSSIFEMMPQLVVFPKDINDLKALVKFVNENKKDNPHLSLTARAAGTCMSGGTLNNSIIVSLTEHINKLVELKVRDQEVIVEPGLFYRDFEKELDQHDLLLPPYTSSKRLNTVGGMVANNSGGEKSLGYGKTEKYVEKLKVILSDGEEYEIKKMTKDELVKRIECDDTLSKIYKKVFDILDKNRDLIAKHKPRVTKNSAGYTIWDVLSGEAGSRTNVNSSGDETYFDAPKLFVGSQGTLGIITEITFSLIKKKKHQGILMIFMQNYDNLPQIVNTVMKHKPDCFESFDHYTFELALKYVEGFGKILKLSKDEVIKAFHPEFARVEKNGIPELTLLVEYEDDDLHTIHENLNKLNAELSGFDNLETYMTHNADERAKYWAIRRESFGLLKSQVKGKYAAPFIDDIVVETDKLPEFFPKLYKLLNESKLMYTVAGHIGNGNFHIIPLMEMEDPEAAKKIYHMMDRVFDLVWEYHGSDSGEHNDGLVRAPYLMHQFGEGVYKIFKEIKDAFDPDDIFNPKKKVNVTKQYAEKFLIKDSTPLKGQITFTR
ncbi:MAG TPA: FAD-binding oxidoreductase [Patescibacteria group bacterium]|nr:FAD-binding oxidoreductase [Patescibacteria group bacterium]